MRDKDRVRKRNDEVTIAYRQEIKESYERLLADRARMERWREMEREERKLKNRLRERLRSVRRYCLAHE